MAIHLSPDYVFSAFIFRKPDLSPPICGKGHDIESPYYRPLQACIGGRKSRRWVPINERRTWPSRANLNKSELALHGNYGVVYVSLNKMEGKL